MAVVAGGQLAGASLTVVAGGFLNADSQSFYFKATAGNIGQLDDLSADIRLQSVKQVFGLLRLADGQGELGPQLVKVCSEAANCLARHLAGFKVALLNLDVSHDGGPELFEEEVLEVFPYGVIDALVVQALVPRILNVVEKVLSCMCDLQTVIVIVVWPGVVYLVAGADKLEVLLVHFALVLRGLWGLLMTLCALRLLVR